MQNDILVIVPCYNEENSIAQVIAELQATCPQCDYLVVNDCSTDASRAVLLAGGHNHISLPVNLGIGGGVQSGYLYAVEKGYAVTVQMDGDGQHDPAYLARLCAPVLAGEMDMCIGSRFITKKGFQTSRARRAGIRLLSRLIFLLTGKRVLDVTSGFRACGRALTAYYAENYAQDYPEPEAIISALVNGYRVGEIPVVMREREMGVSSIGTLHGIYYMVKVALALVTFRLIIGKKKRPAGREAAPHA